MRKVRVHKTGWSHRLYVKPESFIQRLIIQRKGYSKNNGLIGHFGWYCHPKHMNNQ